MSTDNSANYGPQEYLFYRLLSRLDEEGKLNSLYRTRLWKLACETDYYLQNDLKRDIQFPRYWYQYGEIPKIDDLNTDFYSVSKNAEYRSILLTQRLERGAFVLTNDVREDIDRAVDWIVEKFLETDTYDIKDYHYENRAPNDFIRTFDNFRDELDDADFDQSALSQFVGKNDNGKGEKEELLDRLNQLVKTYPEDYDVMETAFLKWEDTMRLLIQNEEEEKAEELLELFWRYLSKAELRIHHNQNITERELEKWQQERDSNRDGFRDTLREYRDEILLEREQEDILTDEEVQDEYLRSLDLPVPDATE